MPKRANVIFRPVTPLNPAIWKDAYEYLASNNEDYLNCVEDSVVQGYTPKEIYRHILREAGYHRQEMAKRCENAARYILADQEQL